MTNEDGVMTSVNGKVGVVLQLAMLWSGSPCFHLFNIVWTEEIEPTPSNVTGVMTANQGLCLDGGGLISWDPNETIAMTVRLIGHEQKETENESETTT